MRGTDTQALRHPAEVPIKHTITHPILKPCAGSMSMKSAACKIAIPSAPPSSSEWLCPSLLGWLVGGVVLLLFATVRSVIYLGT